MDLGNALKCDYDDVPLLVTIFHTILVSLQVEKPIITYKDSYENNILLQMAPETFRRLAQGEAAMRKAMGGNLGALQCTHPRSETRVQMLEEELGMMKDNTDLALQKVMHKVPYWML